MQEAKKEPKKPTIADVAARAGVSIATVSYILNGKAGNYTEATRQKILAVVDDLGYEPDFTARSLARGRSHLIGLLLPLTIREDRTSALLRDNPFYGELIDGMMEVTGPRGYDVLIAGFPGPSDAQTWIRRRNLDGVVYLGLPPEAEAEALEAARVPVVLIDAEAPAGRRFARVITDEEQAAAEAVGHLLAQGHRDIALVTGRRQDSPVLRRRFEGYRRALADAGVEPTEARVLEDAVSFEGGYRLGRRFRTDCPGATAVFCTSDIQALGLVRSLQDQGVWVPEEVSVVGFDNIATSLQMTPALTTVAQDIGTKGRLAARAILEALEAEAPAPGLPPPLVVPHQLLVRQSTALLM